MKPNVGGLDRTARIVIGVALLLIAIFAPIETTWRIVALIVAAIGFVTAAARFCPINAALGVNTCTTEGEKK